VRVRPPRAQSPGRPGNEAVVAGANFARRLHRIHWSKIDVKPHRRGLGPVRGKRVVVSPGGSRLAVTSGGGEKGRPESSPTP
jgi:hypothetical protein